MTFIERTDRFGRASWLLLGMTILVILWGVIVRATGSGAGCGSDWPRCNGAVLPTLASIETQIEFIHRVTSALLGPLALGQLLWARRRFGRGRIFNGALAFFLLILVEGAIGAFLVRLELVADNPSGARAWWMGAHLLNTLFLLAAGALTAWWATREERPLSPPAATMRLALGVALGATLLVGASGAVTALGDTLFPVGSLAEGLRQDLDPGAHFAVRLRLYHPLLAIGTGLYLIMVASQLRQRYTSTTMQRLALGITGLVLIQLLGGFLNVLLRAPIWMQLLHLLLADLLWIALVLTSALTLELEPRSTLSPAVGAPDPG